MVAVSTTAVMVPIGLCKEQKALGGRRVLKEEDGENILKYVVGCRQSLGFYERGFKQPKAYVCQALRKSMLLHATNASLNSEVIFQERDKAGSMSTDPDRGWRSARPQDTGLYQKELEIASQAVQLGCMLSQRVQERILRNEERTNSKSDRSLVTVADWAVQAVISWMLSQAFPNEQISLMAEEDTKALRGMDGMDLLQRVVGVVNECLSDAAVIGIEPPEHPLGTIDVLKAINKGSAHRGESGRHWVLDPIDGTLGFVRGDQYAIALGMIQNGEVVLGVLGCPNYPMRKRWLNYDQKYYRLVSKMFPPKAGLWHKGCVITARKGAGKAWMEPLVWNSEGSYIWNPAQSINVSKVNDPAEAILCEPVEKANSSHTFTAGVAHSLGLRKQPLRVYSMAKYAAIARGDVEIFMKFAKAGYKEKIWDHAAGVLIVQEAGGMVTDAGGQPLDFSKGRYLEGLDRGIVATSGKELHEKIISAVDASWNSSRL